MRVKQIGSGQFGEVFEGSYGGKKVAIKTLKDVDDDNRQSFLAEASAMAYVITPLLNIRSDYSHTVTTRDLVDCLLC